LLPGPGSYELGRVHLLERQWETAFELVWSAGMHIDLHWPLPAEFRMIEWVANPDSYWRSVDPVVQAAIGVASRQARPPALVLHAAADDETATRQFLEQLLDRLVRAGSGVVPVVELRAPAGIGDNRFDRRLQTLISALEPLGSDAIGICWDIAHDWEADGQVSRPTAQEMRWIRHVHLHDNRPDGHVHGPVGTGDIPWEQPIRHLSETGYSGSVTLEIRYRYATEHGDPWSVLVHSLRRVRSVLEEEQLESHAHR
ncbi:MAG: sugar phosphate isomerase/epimerase, partial [Chloroflexota bacterium]|nr:sugar phosphate isomerase/epimerase [Chloroflexota bacterium]